MQNVQDILNNLRRDIETCELPHAAYQAQLEFLTRRIQQALNGFAPAIEVIVGPTRVGKSMLVNALLQTFRTTQTPGKRQIEVLKVKILKSVTTKMLPWVFLHALKVPIPTRMNEVELTFYLVQQLKLLGVRVIVVEEASKFVEEGAKVPARGVADWLFDLTEDAKVTLLLFGVPRLLRLVRSNEQFRSRASAPREFRPYDYRVPKELASFLSCLKTYCEKFRIASYPIEVPMNVLWPNVYLVSGGSVGEVATFMGKLIDQLHGHAFRAVVFDDCEAAAEAMSSAGDPQHRPFSSKEVQPLALSAAHAALLTRAEMQPRPLKATA